MLRAGKVRSSVGNNPAENMGMIACPLWRKKCGWVEVRLQRAEEKQGTEKPWPIQAFPATLLNSSFTLSQGSRVRDSRGQVLSGEYHGRRGQNL